MAIYSYFTMFTYAGGQPPMPGPKAVVYALRSLGGVGKRQGG